MMLSLTAYLISAGAVILAEIGDKTQLLAIAFATKYKASRVIIGIFLATLLSHGLAVALGSIVGRIESIQIFIQSLAAFSFIFFGFWTLKGDKEEGIKNQKTRFGPIIAVAAAFFIAEIGDKTQLAAMALSVRFPHSFLSVLAGTTTGMLISNAFGITCGVILCRKIPERTLKIISASAFMFFGVVGTYQTLVSNIGMYWLNAFMIALVLLLVCTVVFVIIIRNGYPSVSENPASQYCHSKK